MLVSEIVTRVRSAIDELMENDSDFLRDSEDEKNLTQIIIDKIGYALQFIIENAPLEKLDGDVLEDQTASDINYSIDGTTLIGTVTLPDDLLRIIEARFSSWTQSPTPESDRSQTALMQQDEYARGSWDRPANILTYNGATRVLKMYCAQSLGDSLSFVFVRRPDVSSIVDTTSAVSVPPQLEASLIYQVAAMTMTAFKEDVAATLFAIAQRYLDPKGVKSEE